MTRLRAEKIERIANDIPDVEVVGDEDGGDLLVLGWGSTYGVIRTAVQRARAAGQERLAGAPALPQPVPEEPRRRAQALQEGADPRDQPRPAALLIRGKFLVDAVGLNQVTGRPFTIAEVEEKILEMVD